MEDLSAQREQMVERQLAARGIAAPAVLETMAEPLGREAGEGLPETFPFGV